MQRTAQFLFWLTLPILLFVSPGCDSEPLADAVQQVSGIKETPSRTDAQLPTRQDDQEPVTIASFNIQVLGQSKLGKPEAMDILARVARRFDVLAIQEIRSKEQDVMPRFVERINSDGSRYDFVIGPRLGRTISKEQYAYVYDTSRMEVIRDSTYTVPDPADYLHREPMVTRFRVRGPDPEHAFTFELVNIHTDPDETDQELDALADVFQYVQQHNPDEDDVILLGDLNVDENNLGLLGSLPAMHAVVRQTPTNTRKTKTYDNIAFNQRATTEYQGHWGVLDLMAEFQLTEDQALDVSDHMPVWATFSRLEDRAEPYVASQPAGPGNQRN